MKVCDFLLIYFLITVLFVHYNTHDTFLPLLNMLRETMSYPRNNLPAKKKNFDFVLLLDQNIICMVLIVLLQIKCIPCKDTEDYAVTY